MRLAIVPSNQSFSGEEAIWIVAADEAVAEATRQGVTAKKFWISGKADGDTNTVEHLSKMMDEVMAWKPTHSLSFHSNTGSGTQYEYPLYGIPADKDWATAFGRNAAARIGFIFRVPAYRTDLTYFSHTKALGPGRTLLSETGEHQTAASRAFLTTYARFIGIQLVRAFLQSTGFLKYDGPVPSGILVPPGAQFDKYRPYPPYTRLLKYTIPVMHGADVLFVQNQLIKMKVVSFTSGNSWFGPQTRDGVKAAQKVFGLPVTGEVDAVTYAKFAGV